VLVRIAAWLADDRPVIRLIGTLNIWQAGRLLADAEVGSRKARTLLALLAVKPGRMVPVERIAANLWPGTPPQDPAHNVMVLVSRLRGMLGRAAPTIV
jgi:DNA-binding SARP family transcriptional activator